MTLDVYISIIYKNTNYFPQYQQIEEINWYKMLHLVYQIVILNNLPISMNDLPL